MIATFIYKDSDASFQDKDTDILELPPPIPPMTVTTFTDLSEDDDGYMAEGQHLYHRSMFYFITGAGHFTSNRNNVLQISQSPSFGEFPDIVSESDIKHTNLYIYSKINYPKSIIWTIGGSADFFEGGIVDETHLDPNPKLGLEWTPFSGTTLRAAAFRVFKRTILSSQTIEPTQVAGFNQFFDDGEGTESWRYGFAVDQKFSSDMYAGVEYSVRELDVPFTDVPEPPALPGVSYVKWKEKNGRAYFYWTPLSWLAFSSEYQYERFDRDEAFAAGIENVETHTFPIGINLYHNAGFSAKFKATYRTQNGEFVPQESAVSLDGTDSFWTADASIGYRLPKRHGLLTLEVKNLFDESFNFQDTDPSSPVLQPERSWFFKITVAL